MKILWLVNIIMPEMAIHMGIKPTVSGGWLTGALQAVRSSGHSLVICTVSGKQRIRFEKQNVAYLVIPRADFSDLQEAFRSVLLEVEPDVVHIYGTEYEQSWALASVTDPARLLVTIQGAMTYLKDHVYAGIPEKICKDTIIHKVLRFLHRGGSSIELQKISFEQRAEYEKKVLNRAVYINGGSQWGNAVARSVNPECKVLDCGLILRESFYKAEPWQYEECRKYSILILFSYPIKGFHVFLDALDLIVKRFPETEVYVIGSKLAYRHYTGVKAFIQNKAQDYNWYIQKKIEGYGLQKHLHFLGYLPEDKVLDQMRKANVFISASSLENQATTLGEAMMVGLPSAASCVGAVQELISDGVSGFMYPFPESYILADRVIRIFKDPVLAKKISENGRRYSAALYDKKKNAANLLNMYHTVIQERLMEKSN